jgi:hypothetical protein
MSPLVVVAALAALGSYVSIGPQLQTEVGSSYRQLAHIKRIHQMRSDHLIFPTASALPPWEAVGDFNGHNQVLVMHRFARTLDVLFRQQQGVSLPAFFGRREQDEALGFRRFALQVRGSQTVNPKVGPSFEVRRWHLPKVADHSPESATDTISATCHVPCLEQIDLDPGTLTQDRSTGRNVCCVRTLLSGGNSRTRLADRDHQGDDLAYGDQDSDDHSPKGPLRELGALLGRDGIAAIGIGSVGAALQAAGWWVGLQRCAGNRSHGYRLAVGLWMIGVGLFVYAFWPGLSATA